jgi:flagella basal body P-ring formation protein FlgA
MNRMLLRWLASLMCATAALEAAAEHRPARGAEDQRWEQALLMEASQGLRERYVAGARIDGIRIASAVPSPPCEDFALSPVRLIESPPLPSRRMFSMIPVTCPNSPPIDIPVWLAVRAAAPVVVATRDIPLRSKLSKDDFTIQVRDLDAAAHPPLQALDPSGLRAARMIRANAPISARDVESRPAVERGSTLSANARRSGLIIETPTIAQEDGEIGEVIAVRREDSEVELKVRLTSSMSGEVVLR